MPADQWPMKTREFHNHHMNSEVWNDFKFRGDDIIIATYGKSGTTWMQQIIAQLIFNGAEGVETHMLSPWLDLRIMPPEAIAAVEAQENRRFIKTHLPVDALVFSPKAKYIYVGRDGRDAMWSLYNHHRNMKPDMIGALNHAPGRVGPELPPAPETARELFLTWFENDGAPFWPFWDHTRSWWAIRHLPNVKLVHFNGMKADLPGSIRAIAAFLEIEIDEAVFPRIVRHCTFDYMKAHAAELTPLGGSPWEGGAGTFIHKGTNGRWQGELTPAEIAAYEARAVQELGTDCASWLSGGAAAARAAA